MPDNENSKRYDLEDRTRAFAKATRIFVKDLSKTIANIEDAKQLIRASGSTGANYIEANEALGKRDFVMKLKIGGREAKECCYRIRLIDPEARQESSHAQLLAEANELMKIFGAMVRQCED